MEPDIGVSVEASLLARHFDDDQLPSAEDFTTKIEPTNVPAMEPDIGESVEASLLARHFDDDQLPSAEDFTTKIEPTNVPAVFHGAVKGWKAFSKWNPSDGGLDYLQERAGSATVEAMRSRSAPIFYGDLRGHERVPIPFSTFITSCKFFLENVSSVSSVVSQEDSVVAPERLEESCSTSWDSPDQYYLAQVPILNTEDKERCSLAVLEEDFQMRLRTSAYESRSFEILLGHVNLKKPMPIFLTRTALASVNLWMNMARSRSSTHYDPHHNLLCVVAGCKKVVLWPPSACCFLYPMSIYGEASNHSAVDIENPDFSVHLRAKYAKEYSQKIILHSGDALFIPEGWFHQVDSEDVSIAVNFWWKSYVMSNMLEHMDAYYIRRILNRLVDKEMVRMLQRSSVRSLKEKGNCQLTTEVVENTEKHRTTNESVEGCQKFDSVEENVISKGNNAKHGLMLHQLEPLALHVLHELISLVHDTVKIVGLGQAAESSCTKEVAGDPRISHLEKDPVANIFLSVDSNVLQKVLLVMAHHFPRTLEALILHTLSPVAAEVLTRKFDEMDQQTTKKQQNEFYQQFYSVFDDQHAAMDVILNGKEYFAFQAFQRVLDQYVGVAVDEPK